MSRIVRGEKFFVRSNLAIEAFDFQIGNFADRSGIGALCQIGGILIPADRCLEILPLLI